MLKDLIERIRTHHRRCEATRQLDLLDDRLLVDLGFAERGQRRIEDIILSIDRPLHHPDSTASAVRGRAADTLVQPAIAWRRGA